MQKQFNLTVAVGPNNTDLSREMEYIKSALLFADNIYLINPMASLFFQLTNEKNQGNERSAIRLISKVIPICEKVAPEFYEKYASIIKEYEQLVYGEHYKKMLMKHKIQLRKMIKKIAIDTNDILKEVIGKDICEDLLLLVKEEVLSIIDFVHPLNDQEGVNDKFYSKLQATLKDSFPIFDDKDCPLLDKSQAAVKFPVVPIEQLTFSDILGMREEFSEQLKSFRNKILKFADDIQLLPRDQNFANACTDLFDREVQPILQEIKDLLADKLNEFTSSNTELVSNIAPAGLISGIYFVLVDKS